MVAKLFAHRDVAVGLVALQGASEAHRSCFSKLGVDVCEVRSRAGLARVTHLVLPGGESTTIRHLLDLFDLTEDILKRHERGELVLFGSCAGAILLGRDEGIRPRRLGLLEASFERNAYGSQTRSFMTEVAVEGDGHRMRGLFIRAPRIVDVGPGIDVLARVDGAPVLIEGPGVLAATFHPELAGEVRVHERFLAMSPVEARASSRACARAEVSGS